MFSTVFLFLFACSLESNEEKAARLTAERTDLIDQLYSEYGGGSWANAAKDAVQEAQKEIPKEDPEIKKSTNDFLSTIKNTFSEADREAFVTHCETIGRGEHASILTDKAKAYFAQQTVKDKCRKAHSLQLEINQLASP